MGHFCKNRQVWSTGWLELDDFRVSPPLLGGRRSLPELLSSSSHLCALTGLCHHLFLPRVSGKDWEAFLRSRRPCWIGGAC